MHQLLCFVESTGISFNSDSKIKVCFIFFSSGSDNCYYWWSGYNYLASTSYMQLLLLITDAVYEAVVN